MEKVFMAVTVVALGAAELESLLTEKLTNKATGAEILPGIPLGFKGVLMFEGVEGVVIDGKTNGGTELNNVKSISITVVDSDGVKRKVSPGNLPKDVCKFILDNKEAFLKGQLKGYSMQVLATEKGTYNGAEFTRIISAKAVAGKPQYLKPANVEEAIWATFTDAQKAAMQ